jgi:hypothetical protein
MWVFVLESRQLLWNRAGLLTASSQVAAVTFLEASWKLVGHVRMSTNISLSIMAMLAHVSVVE